MEAVIGVIVFFIVSWIGGLLLHNRNGNPKPSNFLHEDFEEDDSGLDQMSLKATFSLRGSMFEDWGKD